MKHWIGVLVLVAAPAWASTNQLEVTWGRGSPLGTAQVQGTSEQDGLRGHFWMVDALHHVGPQTYVGMGLGHFTSNDNHTPTFLPPSQATLSSQKTSTLLLGRMDLGASTHFIPYAIAGVGWVKNSLLITSDQGTLVDDSKNTIGYMGGAGVDFVLGDRFLFGLEARYEGSPSQHFAMTPTGVAVTAQSDVRTSAHVFLIGLKAGIKY